MPFKRRYYPKGSRDKYSVEQTNIQTPVSSSWDTFPQTTTLAPTLQYALPVIAPSLVEGMRKVKHFDLTFTSPSDTPIVAYVLAFIPAGYSPNRLNLPLPGNAANMYEPNQFVLSQGFLDFSGGPLRIRCPLSRNLNSGDNIALIVATYADYTATQVYASIRYAITLQ